MVIDRSKHNKYSVNLVYTPSSTTLTEQQTALSGSSLTIYISGGSGSGLTEEQLKKLESIEEGALVNQNAFSTVLVSDGSITNEITAQNPSDTIKFTYVSPIKISLIDGNIQISYEGNDALWRLDENGNLWTDRNVYSTKEISAYGFSEGGSPSGGANYLYELSDVDSATATSPIDNGILQYNAVKKKWVVTDGSGIKPDLTDYATKLYVTELINLLVGTAPDVLDTIYEIAEALNNDPDYVKDIANNLSNLTNRVTKLEDMFEWDNGVIKAKADLYGVGEISAYGYNSGSTPSGAQNLSELLDVDLTNLADQCILQYNILTKKWEATDGSNIKPDLSEYATRSWVISQLDITSLNLKNEFNADIDGINNLLVVINGNITTIQSNITSLQSSVSSINEEILSIKANITTIKGDITDIKSALELLNNMFEWDGTRIKAKADLYGIGEISAYGYQDGSAGSGAQYLYELLDVTLTELTSGQLLQWDGSKWININKDKVGLNESELLQYLTENNYAKKSDIPNVIDWTNITSKPSWITDEKPIYSWTDITNKPTVFTTNIENISDLNSLWDSLLKNEPTVYITRWPSFSEVTDKPTTLSGYGITDGVNSITLTGSGNAVTSASINGHVITLTKGSTFSLSTHNHDSVYVNVNGDTMTGTLTLPTIVVNTRIQLGNAYIEYDSTNNAVVIKNKITDNVINFYATGEVSAYGYNDGTEISGVTYLSELKDVELTTIAKNDILVWNGSVWVNTPMADITPELNVDNITDLNASWRTLLKSAPSAYVTRWPSFSEITSKPTTLAEYGITDGVNAVSVAGSGNAITAASVSGHTLTLTKGSTFLLSSAYTAADVLAKLKTVGGSGSGLDADTLDGAHNGDLTAKLFNYSNDIVWDCNSPTATLHRYYGEGGGNILNKPTSWTYGQLFTIGSITSLNTNLAAQFIWDVQHNTKNPGRLWFRTRDSINGWDKDWGKIAFTTDNVDSATKLQTPRTIWGQNFDGTANVSGSMTSVGNITMSGNITGLRSMKTAYGDDNRSVYMDYNGLYYCAGNNGWAIGINARNLANSASLGAIAGVLGSGDSLTYTYYGGSYDNPAMVIIPNKNIGIGTKNPEYKLYVAGTVGVTNLITAFGGLTTTQYIQIGSGRIYWDSANRALYVKSSDGSSAVNFYATGEVSAYGAGSGGSSGGGVSYLHELSDVTISNQKTDDMLKWNGSKWINVPMSDIKPDLSNYVTKDGTGALGIWNISISGTASLASSVAWANVTSKPTTLSGYGITDAVTIGTTQTITGVKTFSQNTASVMYLKNSADTSNYVALRFMHKDSDVGGIAGDKDGSALYRVNSGFTTVYKLLDTSNYTTTLDTRYIKKAGDTMTGSLKLKTNSLTRNIVYSDSGTDNMIFGDVNGSTVVRGSNISFQNSVGSSIFQINENIGKFTNTPLVGTNEIWHAGNDGSGSGLDADLLDGIDWASFNLERVYTINASSLDKTKFYPIFFGGQNSDNMLLEIKSPGGVSSAEYNTNRFRAIIHSNGWDDSGEALVMLSRYNYQDTKITIGAIGFGQENGGIAVWVRGGRDYYLRCNRTPSLKTSDYTYGTEIYTVGTNLYGGTNTKVTIKWQNNSDRAKYDVALVSSNVASANKLYNPRTIWGQSFDGTANVSGALTGVTTIVASEKIECGSLYAKTGYVYNYTGWFQNNKTGTGLYNSAEDARLYASGGIWYTDKPINPTAKNSKSLGDSSHRWSNIYSVLGNFSGAVTLSSTLSVAGTSTFTGKTTHNGGISVTSITASGNIVASGEITAYSSSDIRLKTNLKELKAINILRKINTFEYDWTEEALLLKTNKNVHGYGIIAQELELIIPEAVTHDMYDKGYLGIDYTKLIPFTISAIKEVDDEVTTLKKKVKELEDRLSKYESSVK